MESGPPRTAAELIAAKWPALDRYWPNLNSASTPQTSFLVLDQLEALYGGAAGGGKSDALLAAGLQYVDVPGYAGLILRRTFKQLSLPGAIMARSKEWLSPFRKTGEIHWNDDDKTWTFPSGATLTFGYLESADDIYRYQGPEFSYIAFDELTQFTEAQYVYMFSRLRQRVGIHVPLRMRAASNPGGVGHAWVKPRLVDQQTRQPGAVFIPAKVNDNPGLDADKYAGSLSYLGPVLQAQLLDGDWGAFEGAAYPMFNPRLHVVPPFDIPDGWERFESVDPGTTNPTCWLVWATDYDGNHIVFDELYVDDPVPHLPDVVAPLLLARRGMWWPDSSQPVAYADPAGFAAGAMTKWGRPPSFADEFANLGIHLVKANNDRVAGYVRIAQLLSPDPDHPFPDWHPHAGQPGSPRLFVFSGCTHLVEQLQGAPLEEIGEPHPGEAVSRKWEGPFGHAHAAARYGALSWPGPSERPPKTLQELLLEPAPDVDLRREALQAHIERVDRPRRRGRLTAN